MNLQDPETVPAAQLVVRGASGQVLTGEPLQAFRRNASGQDDGHAEIWRDDGTAVDQTDPGDRIVSDAQGRLRFRTREVALNLEVGTGAGAQRWDGYRMPGVHLYDFGYYKPGPIGPNGTVLQKIVPTRRLIVRGIEGTAGVMPDGNGDEAFLTVWIDGSQVPALSYEVGGGTVAFIGNANHVIEPGQVVEFRVGFPGAPAAEDVSITFRAELL